MVNSLSYYPEGIDSMVFFQDNDISKVSAVKGYQTLTSQGKYTDANKYLSQHDIYGYFADVFNLFENRIYSLQAHLMSKEKNNPFTSSEEEPTALSDDMIWIDG